MRAVSIKNETRSALGGPRLVYAKVAAEMLPGWELSLVFVGPTKARALNTSLRKKTYTPNVLSYVVGEKSGEIIICPSVARVEAASYGLNPADCILYFFIHGVLHIKGWRHGATMEKCEQELMARFASSASRSLINVTTHSHRHRHRDVPGKDGRRRRTLR
ncbi:MAG: rRNA maturation RNase YbeY [Patescibacteria group bacterium]